METKLPTPQAVAPRLVSMDHVDFFGHVCKPEAREKTMEGFNGPASVAASYFRLNGGFDIGTRSAATNIRASERSHDTDQRP